MHVGISLKKSFTVTLPWSSGKWKRLTFRRSWVRILAPYTGWTFFPHIFVVKIVMMFVWKRPKINEKEAGVSPFLKNFALRAFQMSFRVFLWCQLSTVLHLYIMSIAYIIQRNLRNWYFNRQERKWTDENSVSIHIAYMLHTLSSLLS